jgi:hypothetical protein
MNRVSSRMLARARRSRHDRDGLWAHFGTRRDLVCRGNDDRRISAWRDTPYDCRIARRGDSLSDNRSLKCTLVQPARTREPRVVRSEWVGPLVSHTGYRVAGLRSGYRTGPERRRAELDQGVHISKCHGVFPRRTTLAKLVTTAEIAKAIQKLLSV